MLHGAHIGRNLCISILQGPTQDFRDLGGTCLHMLAHAWCPSQPACQLTCCTAPRSACSGPEPTKADLCCIPAHLLQHARRPLLQTRDVTNCMYFAWLQSSERSAAAAAATGLLSTASVWQPRGAVSSRGKKALRIPGRRQLQGSRASAQTLGSSAGGPCAGSGTCARR